MQARSMILMAAALCGACAATGELYADHAAQRGTVSAQLTRLTVYRAADKAQYSGRAAALLVDGKPAAELRLGGFHTIDLAPGEHRIEVDLWDAPGRCGVSFSAQPGTIAYFEVAPRPANLAAGAPGALINAATPAGLIGGLSLMLGGMAAESAGKACGGAFSITQVDAETAASQLAGLRESR